LASALTLEVGRRPSPSGPIILAETVMTLPLVNTMPTLLLLRLLRKTCYNGIIGDCCITDQDPFTNQFLSQCGCSIVGGNYKLTKRPEAGKKASTRIKNRKLK
jgi:hypothetical protein